MHKFDTLVVELFVVIYEILFQVLMFWIYTERQKKLIFSEWHFNPKHRNEYLATD